MEELKVHQSKRKHHRRSSSRSSSRRGEIDNNGICETSDIQQQQQQNDVDTNPDTTTTINTVNLNQPDDDTIKFNKNAVTTQQLKNVPAANIIVTTTPPPPPPPAPQSSSTAPPPPLPPTDNEQIPTTGGTEKLQSGILTYMDKEIKTHRKPPQSLSDPTASPAQRSTRSRSSLEKSPRRKRSKSESRRRRERKMIAAGELEVRQANETLLRYLKQCTEINDASLSGELEIDKSIEDRRVHRKTKSQRERRTLQHGGNGAGGLSGGSGTSMPGGKSTIGTIRDRIPSSGLTTILTELVDDIMPNHGEIYNPFTPVISPTEGPTRIDKMFIQTSHGYRSVDHSFYKIHSENDIESNRPSISNSVNLSCVIQRIWILFSNICHGLLGGLALAHLLFVTTTKPFDWTSIIIKQYSAFAEIYANTFYFLVIICMVSVLDRLDLCRLSLSNTNETISFRWIIIVIIYLGTIILSLSAESVDERIYLTNFNLTHWEEEVENTRVLSIWNSLSIARSIGAILGWILIGCSPNDDLLYEHLIEMEKYQLNN